MKVGVIGVGAVGSACKKGFELLGHEIKVHDPRLNTVINDVKIKFLVDPKEDGCVVKAIDTIAKTDKLPLYVIV